jgi:hypothetical protein
MLNASAAESGRAATSSHSSIALASVRMEIRTPVRMTPMLIRDRTSGRGTITPRIA